ncbi:MAG: hypothetical protein QW815_01980 [Nitrososphaerota archaeon]
MGRRRRKVIRVVKKKLPKVFACPRCGFVSIRLSTKASSVLIACGSCGLREEYSLSGKKEPIDIYNEFVDRFVARFGG